MALRSIFKWQNQDSTLDLNSRLSSVISKGVISGGFLSTVSGQLKIQIGAFSAISNDGMLVVDDNPSTAGLLSIPLGQTSAVAVQAKYNVGAAPTLSYLVQEISTFSNRVDRNNFILLGQVTPSGIIQIAPSDITYINREGLDKLGRSAFRGKIASYADVSLLPAPPSFNVEYALVVPALPANPVLYRWNSSNWVIEDITKLKLGDYFMVIAGSGALPSLFAWDGLEWLNITQAQTIAAELAQHRANLFPNEKHLTDNQADAALGSVGPVSIANRYVTENDPRLPTQNENDALIGSDGAPSAANKYLTEEYAIAQPSILLYGSSPGSSVEINLSNGPIFVGTGGIGSANNYFSFLDYTAERGYINSQGYAPNVSGVYKDILLTIPLNPSVDADSKGFYAASVYLAVDIAIDSSVRVVYGKKINASNLNKGLAIFASPSSEYVASKAVEAIQNIKGRPFNILLPSREKNKALRQSMDGIVGYLGAALETNLVADKKDFERMAADSRIRPEAVGNYARIANLTTVYSPGHGLLTGSTITVISSTGSPTISSGDKVITVVDLDTFNFVDSGSDTSGVVNYTYALFLFNVGINPVYRFINTSLTSFTYTESTGQITYGGAIDLSQCEIGNLFQDSAGNKFLVTSVTPGGGSPYLNIVSIETGLIPPETAVDSAIVLKSKDGSVSVNNNPRDCLLSEFKFNYGSDVIPVNYLDPLPDEFEKQTGQMAFSVKREDGSTEPRVVFYGGWQNFPGEDGKKSYVRNTGAYGKIVITGFFTDVLLWMRRSSATPTLAVQLNEEGPVLIDTKQSLYPGSDAHRKYQKIHVLSVPDGYQLSNEPNTCTLSIQSVTADPLQIYAIELCRRSIDSYAARTSALVESGRAFDLTKIVTSDVIDSTLAVSESWAAVPARGHRKIISVTDTSSAPSVNNFSLVDLDTGLAGTVVAAVTPNTITNVSGPGVSGFRVNDLVLVSTKSFNNSTYYATGTLLAGTSQVTGVSLDPAVAIGWVIDGPGVPTGTTIVNIVGTTVTMSNDATSSGLKNLRFYLTGDAQIVKITSILDLGGNNYQWGVSPNLDAGTYASGPGVNILHVCSTDSTIPNVGQEDEIARYSLTDDFCDGFADDFESSDSSDRFIVGKDGTTILAGTNLSIVSSGITGQIKAVNITASGSLRIAALCTRLDFIVSNSSSANPVYISVDGSTPIAFNFSDASSYRRTIFFNARYQTHEIQITDPSGVLCISDVILFGPAKPTLNDFPVELADMRGLARYIQSSSYQIIGSLSRYPMGAVFLEASTYCTYQDNLVLPANDWIVSTNYNLNLYGRYIYSNVADSYIEFYFLGDTFEIQYILGPDHGDFRVYVDGTELNAGSNYEIIGDYSVGYVVGYSPAYTRKNIGAKILYPSNEQEWSVHYVKVVVKGSSYGPSTDNKVAITGVWLGSAVGSHYCTNQLRGLYGTSRDLRKFLALPGSRIDSGVQQPIIADNRAGTAACGSGSTYLSVSYTNPLPDTNYVLMVNFSNTVDAYPLLQPVYITTKTSTGFTATWNAPLDTVNYKLNYFVAPYK
jgi:hypothetical protein